MNVSILPLKGKYNAQSESRFMRYSHCYVTKWNYCITMQIHGYDFGEACSTDADVAGRGMRAVLCGKAIYPWLLLSPHLT